MFQVQAKISTIWPVFPDYLSVSHDYDVGYYTFQLTDDLLDIFCFPTTLLLPYRIRFIYFYFQLVEKLEKFNLFD